MAKVYDVTKGTIVTVLRPDGEGEQRKMLADYTFDACFAVDDDIWVLTNIGTRYAVCVDSWNVAVRDEEVAPFTIAPRSSRAR